VLDKVKTLIDNLRGRKFDVILLTNGMVKIIEPNTINTTSDEREIRLGGTSMTSQPNFVSIVGSYNPTNATTSWSSDIDNQFHNYGTGTPFVTTGVPTGFWFIYNNKLYFRSLTLTSVGPSVYTYGPGEDGTAQEVGTIQGTYKISLSFNGIQTNEPYINNGADRVNIFFSGSATIVQSNVSLGNDIVLTTIQAGKNTGTNYVVEPTEIPASLSLNDDTFPLYSTGYQSIDRNLAISNKINYSFVYDSSNALYNAMYRYARFGKALIFNNTTELYVADANALDPNAIYTIKEYRNSFGVVTIDKIYAKINDVGTSNTNGDVMTITCGFKVGAY
jgi:hypothetical protein